MGTMRYSHRRRDMAPRFLYREYNSPVAIPCGRDFIAAALGCSFAGIEDTSDEKRTLEMRAPAKAWYGRAHRRCRAANLQPRSP
jgi:hypothetical protein